MEALTGALPPSLEARIHRTLSALGDRGLTVATAESCTGGLLASVLTDVDGLGHVFDRGFVTYTDQAKISDLGVSSSLIALHGSVSAQAADAMASGALRCAKADLAVAITGFAGPAGPDDEEGRVHLSLARRGHPIRRCDCRFGPLGRGPIRIKALDAAIGLLEEAVTDADVASHPSARAAEQPRLQTSRARGHADLSKSADQSIGRMKTRS